MIQFAYFMLAIWLPIVFGLFMFFRPRQAVLLAMFGGWMFLPEAIGFDLPWIPAWDKLSATNVSVLLAICLFCPERLLALRFKIWDCLIVIYCLVPMASTISNGIGGSLPSAMYGGMGLILKNTVMFGMPYLIGRAMFTNVQELRELAVGLFYAGLVYIPFALVEVRMSPQIHHWVYGFEHFAFIQSKRGGGYRPTVFMQHGLMLGFFMTAATLAGVWCWQSKMVRSVFGMPMWMALGALFVTTVMCKSTGALALLVMGLGMFACFKLLRWRWPMLAVLLIVPVYLGLRISQTWDGEELVEVVAAVMTEDRAGSLGGRFWNEKQYVGKTLQRPLLGWSRWNRGLVRDPDTGENTTVPDSLWIIVFNQEGLVNLTAVFGLLLVPTVLVIMRTRTAKDFFTYPYAPVALLANILLLFAIESLVNAMLSPAYIMASGALIGLLSYRQVPEAAPARAPVRRPVPLEGPVRPIGPATGRGEVSPM